MRTLTMSGDTGAVLRDACERAYPEEACGLLVGAPASDRRVLRVVVGRNALRGGDSARDAFALDPADFLRAEGEARDAGLEILGAFHSHPDRPAWPSTADEAAAQPGWSHVIASVRGDGSAGRLADIRSWALSPGDASAAPPTLREEIVEWATAVPPVPGSR